MIMRGISHLPNIQLVNSPIHLKLSNNYITNFLLHLYREANQSCKAITYSVSRCIRLMVCDKIKKTMYKLPTKSRYIMHCIIYVLCIKYNLLSIHTWMSGVLDLILPTKSKYPYT